MTCISPIAPAPEVIGVPSDALARPPLSWRMTSRIQVSGTWKRIAASWM
jgi:hypothetical protein